ncbi:TonB-dependent receptor [Algoriphagus sp. PAP.12]|uniref:TonB-dependent receptor n=1 Tax=Algoriphagus sp. PAP.12 TaxID=2996678 RepID=UPI00227B8ABF|nr:TonB-dependent receptor [Algoriphagus sp. PAP.12]
MILLVWFMSTFGFQTEGLDTLSLKEVEVTAPVYQRFGQGQKAIAWTSEDIQGYNSRTLSDLLQETSPIFARQYGPGMLSSPSFRGTSAGHTALFWNGLPINSPSLGQSDLSLIPILAIDQADLQFGSSGALIGNESIGGSIQLRSTAKFSLTPHLLFSQEFGSFGTYNTRIKAGFSTEKLAFQTKAYRLFTENNYRFEDLSKPGTPTVDQEHGQVNQYGIVQDLSWKTKENQLLNSSFWYNRANREIQAPMGSNTQDLQEDESWKWSLDYEIFMQKASWLFKSGLVQDHLTFNGSLSKTRQLFFGAEWDYSTKNKWKFHAGTRFSFIKGDLSTYSATDQRIEFFESIQFLANEKLTFSFNGRHFVYLDNFKPLIPSLGLDWKIQQSEGQSLTLKASGSMGFKVPTLNDRFWKPGGNPDLLPEKSWNAESGFLWQSKNLEQSLTGYWMDVDNWIIWLPNGSVWSPQNIRKVRSEGIEYQGKANFQTGKIHWNPHWQYSFNRAVSIQGIAENDPSLGKQLPYTPQHQATVGIGGKLNGFSISFAGDYTGKRSVTADNPRMMDPFTLWNSRFSYEGFSIGKIKIPMQFRIQNLFDTNYQVLYLRPMPGRSYHFNLSIQL